MKTVLCTWREVQQTVTHQNVFHSKCCPIAASLNISRFYDRNVYYKWFSSLRVAYLCHHHLSAATMWGSELICFVHICWCPEKLMLAFVFWCCHQGTETVCPIAGDKSLKVNLLFPSAVSLNRLCRVCFFFSPFTCFNVICLLNAGCKSSCPLGIIK